MIYSQQHRFYAGVDRHARSMFSHIVDEAGGTVLKLDLDAKPDEFARACPAASGYLRLRRSASAASRVNHASGAPRASSRRKAMA